jgi:transcriptional regulator with XRE-family HTH domain
MKIHENLLRFMGERGMVAVDIIRLSGLSPSAVYAILAGHRRYILSSTLQKLAKSLGVSVEEITREHDLA